MTGPLEGLRVVDLSSVVSGPVCTATLADQGADVIKVESLGGDQMRRGRSPVPGMAPGFLTCNRGKRSIAVDLKREEGRDVLWRIIDGADVLVQNFRPGVIDRLGFGEPEVRARNGSIVYVSISGVGASGPYAEQRVYDPVIQALSGLADIQADPLSGRPRMVRTLIADKTTGIYAAQATTAALLHRARTGEGQHVQVAMLDVMLSYLWPEGMAPLTYVSDGDDVPPMAAHDMIFETSDGYLTAGTVSDAEWRALCEALQRPQWLTDPRFETTAQRQANRTERLSLVSEVLRTDTRAAWLERLRTAGVPCAPVLERREVLDDPQVVDAGLVETFDYADAGKVRQARPAAHFAATPAAIAGLAPRLGEHTRAVLAEAGYDDDAVAALFDAAVVAEG